MPDLINALGWLLKILVSAFGLFICIVIVGFIYWVIVNVLRDRRRSLRELRVQRGEGRPVEDLAKRLKLEPDVLRTFQPQYRIAFIKKRSGGERKLAIPDDATKALQRTIARRLLKRLRVHPACIGFEPSKSIVHNALPHVGRAVVLKFDIVDFFPRTTAARIDRYFRMIGWNAEAAGLLTKICTHDDGLPQGAPTSPRLSNLVNFGLDYRFDRIAAARKGVYTRYADDLTFSFPKDYPKRMRGVCQSVKRALQKHGYELHRKKSHTIRKHQRQMVTGLVVNDTVNLPRETRRKLRAIEHRLQVGKQATLTPAQFEGWKALRGMIETQRESSVNT